jgi:dTDP-4-dehydrorhamnose 3,5-epimerase
MEILTTTLPGALLIRPRVFADDRGFFCETFRAGTLAEHGVGEAFVQDNHSRSSRGVLRGMHFAIGDGAAKLVRCGRGAIMDVIVDIRHRSPTYGRWEAFELNDENMHVLYVPVGFAHGFCVLSDVADVIYKQSSYYRADIERGFAWDDPAVGIRWPLTREEIVVSDRADGAPSRAEIAPELPFTFAPPG